MIDPLRTIGDVRVLPVVTIDDADIALDLAAALNAGGLGVIEVTLRTEAGLAAISTIADAMPAICVGAGSVTTVGQANAAIDAGAQFLVSPGFDRGVVGLALDRGIPCVPGVATATELMTAVASGVDVVKVFPAEQVGGVAAIRAFASVWPEMRLVPTGGVTSTNASEYLALDAVLAVGGTWIAPRHLIASQDWTQITANAAAAVRAAGEG